MKKILIFLFFISNLIYSQSIISKLTSNKWIDLSYSFDETTIYWPTNEPFKHEKNFEGINDKGYFYSSYKYSAEEHGGTHFDAPIHFGEGKPYIHEVPIEKLMGEAIVIDITKQSEANRDYELQVEDILNWEKKNGKIPKNAIVFIRTGFGKYYPDKIKYMGTDKKGQEGVDNLHFPGLGPKAAEWLAKNRKVLSIGIDTPSIDFGQSKMFETHRTLFANDITAMENVANLDKLPAKGSFAIALPMKIKYGSGAPVRIVAMIK